MSKGKKLEDIELWRKASRAAEDAYASLDTFPEEEKWGMAYQLRQQAFLLSSEIAEGYGSIDPRDILVHFGHARRSAFSIKNVYHMAHKTGIAALEPESMVLLNNLVDEIDAEIKRASEAIEGWVKQLFLRKQKYES